VCLLSHATHKTSLPSFTSRTPCPLGNIHFSPQSHSTLTHHSMPSIDFAQYVVERLKQCGIRYVFGVPGDYNLELLDYVEKDKDLTHMPATAMLGSRVAPPR
jgi:hypothetical protein